MNKPKLAPRVIGKKHYSNEFCIIGVALHNLSITDAKDLQEQLDDPFESSIVIERRLRNSGIDGSDSTIGKHRKGWCHCQQIKKKANND